MFSGRLGQIKRRVSFLELLGFFCYLFDIYFIIGGVFSCEGFLVFLFVFCKDVDLQIFLEGVGLFFESVIVRFRFIFFFVEFVSLEGMCYFFCIVINQGGYRYLLFVYQELLIQVLSFEGLKIVEKKRVFRMK